MSFQLLDLVKGYFNNEMISKAASFLGESESQVSTGLASVIPATLAGLVNKAESGDTSTLASLAKSAFDSGILDSVASTFSQGGGGVPSIGPSLITGIFGNKYGAVANAISSFTGLKGANISSLFGTVAPLALGLLGKYVKDNNAAPGALASLLGSQKQSILSAVPSGLNLASVLGGGHQHHTHAAAPVARETRRRGIWPTILSAIGLVSLFIILARACGVSDHADEHAVKHDTTVITKTNIIVINREPIKVTLPNGVVLDAYKGGIEDLLVAFLKDSAAKPGNDNWFDFSDLNFKFGTAEILPESRKEVDNIAQILKAFPSAKIKIGGYTDKVGDEAANKKLSGERANAVLQALTGLGVGSQLTGAEGYGSEFAKFPASAPEEDRVKDRRVSVSVRAK